MKRYLWTTFSFLLVTIFVGFLRYLLAPLWPNLSEYLLNISENIKSFLNIKWDTYTFSVIVFILFFIVVYTLFTIIASLIRKKAKLVYDEINPHEKYKSTPYSIMKVALIVFFIPLIFAYGKSFLLTLSEINHLSEQMLFFLAGFAVFTLVWIPLWRKFRFFSIFEHEITHMIMALCFFHKPKAFHVDENEGGWVKLAGVNFIITLSPYFLLTFCFLILPFYILIKPDFYNYYFLFMGVLVSYHTLSTFKETNFNRQPDIIFNGKFFSLIVIILGNIFCYGFILSFVLGGFEETGNFIRNGWLNFVGIFRGIFIY